MTPPTKTGFRDVKALVLARIRNRTWPANSIIPAETDLAREFGCARSTVNRALRELADEGFVERKRKAGTRVIASPERKARLSIPLIRVEIENTGATYRYNLVKRAVMAPPGWLRARLGLATGDRVLHLQCMHYSDNAPFGFEDRWINLGVVPKAINADFRSLGPNEWLVNALPFSDAEFAFSATAADRELAEYLQLHTAEPVFTAERTTWLHGAPVTFARIYFGRGYRMTTRL